MFQSHTLLLDNSDSVALGQYSNNNIAITCFNCAMCNFTQEAIMLSCSLEKEVRSSNQRKYRAIHHRLNTPLFECSLASQPLHTYGNNSDNLLHACDIVWSNIICGCLACAWLRLCSKELLGPYVHVILSL